MFLEGLSLLEYFWGRSSPVAPPSLALTFDVYELTFWIIIPGVIASTWCHTDPSILNCQNFCTNLTNTALSRKIVRKLKIEYGANSPNSYRSWVINISIVISLIIIINCMVTNCSHQNHSISSFHLVELLRILTPSSLELCSNRLLAPLNRKVKNLKFKSHNWLKLAKIYI